MASKKSRRSPAKQENPFTETVGNALTDLHNEMAKHGPAPLPEANKPQPLSLADIRNEVLRAHKNTAHTIADLEAWRAEIEATIAFLKARGR